jgi:hypothetical protein
MAFIPDEALDRYDELQPSSQLAYSYFCRFRNHKTGIAPKTLDECAEKYKWSRATKFNVQKELIEGGWIEKTDGGVRPLVGDFSPVNKSKKLDSKTKEALKELKQNGQSKNLDSKVKKSKFLDFKRGVSLKNWTKKSKNLDCYIRNTSLYQQESQDSNESFDSKSQQPAKKQKNFTDAEKAQRLFEFWKKRMRSPRSVFTKDRNEKAKKILASIGYSDCIRAILGCYHSDWHMARDPDNTHTFYNEFERIFKKPEETEKFINRYFKYLAKQLQANGVVKYGKIQPNSSGHSAGNGSANGGRKPTNFEISRSRDYSAFDGLDPTEAFKT